MTAERQLCLSDEQLSAAASLAGVPRDAGSVLALLPTVTRPLAVLRGTGTLSTDNSQLRPDVAEAIRYIAADQRCVTFTVSTMGSKTARRGRICQSAVLISGGQQHVLSLAESNTEVATMVIDLLDWRCLADSGDAAQVDLSSAGSAVLLTAAELVRSRASDRKPVFTLSRLEKASEGALKLNQSVGQMDRGAAELVAAGVLMPISRGWGSTQLGDRMIRSLAGVQQIADFTVGGGGRIFLLGARDRLWIVEVSTTHRWISGGSREVKQKISDLLGRVDAPSEAPTATGDAPQLRCPNPICHAPIAPGKKFCSRCGTPVAGDAPAPPVEVRCPQCNRIAPPGKKFCQGCGQRITA